MQARQLILTASAFVIASAGPAHAQDSAHVAGDSGLQSLVAEALAQNPTIAQRQAAVRAAALRIRPAGSLPDPMLTVGVMDLVLPHFDFNQSDFTEADVELSQEIPWPGSLGARSGVMRAAAAGARAEEGTVRRELTSAMAVASSRLGYTVTALETLRHQRELLEAAVQLSTTRYATGAAPQSDPLQAKLARDRRRECAAEPGTGRLGPGHRDRPGCTTCRGSAAASRRLARGPGSRDAPATYCPARRDRPGHPYDSGRAAGSASRLYALGALWVQACRLRVQVSGLLLRLCGRAPPDLGVAQTESAGRCRTGGFHWGRGWAARRGAPAQSRGH